MLYLNCITQPVWQVNGPLVDTKVVSIVYKQTHLDLADAEMIASTVAGSGATEARAVHPGPTLCLTLCESVHKNVLFF